MYLLLFIIYLRAKGELFSVICVWDTALIQDIVATLKPAKNYKKIFEKRRKKVKIYIDYIEKFKYNAIL